MKRFEWFYPFINFAMILRPITFAPNVITINPCVWLQQMTLTHTHPPSHAQTNIIYWLVVVVLLLNVIVVHSCTLLNSHISRDLPKAHIIREMKGQIKWICFGSKSRQPCSTLPRHLHVRLGVKVKGDQVCIYWHLRMHTNHNQVCCR